MQCPTETDQFILQQVQAAIGPHESVSVCAYLVPPIEGGKVAVFVNAATKMAAFAAITSNGLVLIQTRIGAFKPLLENHGVVKLRRSEIKGTYLGAKLTIELADARMLEYQDNRGSGHVSTQREFFERLEATFGRSEAAARKAQRERMWTILGMGVGLLLTSILARPEFAQTDNATDPVQKLIQQILDGLAL